MIDPTNLPGSDIVLRTLYLRSKTTDLFDTEHDGDENLLTFQVSTHAWSDATGHTWDAEPRWATYLDCSDVFFWGSADAEEVTAENFTILEQTVADVQVLYNKFQQIAKDEFAAIKNGDATAYSHESANAYRLAAPLSWLFAARVRQERPQGASYSYIPADLWRLFDGCGPERNTGLGNPTKPGAYKGPWSEYNEKFFAEQHA